MIARMRRPLVLLVDVTERCNLRCVMCYFANVDRIRFPPFEETTDAHGNMPVALFETTANEFFPRAYRASIGCASEPLLHPRFAELITIAGRHRIPELWILTNLLPLTEKTADAIVRANVTSLSVSIDGVTKETYEKIRIGATWERLHEKLRLFREVRGRRTATQLRVTFTWMQSNRAELREVPRFAGDLGATELDIRYVTPTAGVDVTSELLHGDDLREELALTARDAFRRGLKLVSYPQFDERPNAFVPRLMRRLWRMRAGIERLEHFRVARREQANGCRYPDWNYTIRPNGAVFPCSFFDTPVGMIGRDSFDEISRGEPMARVRDGLRCGAPVGACAGCGEKRDALYRQ